MAYTAWETSAGEAQAEVETYCRHAARGTGAVFTQLTVPSLGAVERWLTVSYHWIRGLLARNGYSTTQTDPSVVAILQELNVLDVCVKVELSLPEESGSGEPNQRFTAFAERRTELIEMITDGTLGAIGATPDSSTDSTRIPRIGGERYSRKELAEEDTDRTQHRVRRGAMQHPGLALPTGEQDYRV